MRINGDKGSSKTEGGCEQSLLPYTGSAPLHLIKDMPWAVLPSVSSIINISVSTRSFPFVSKHAVISSIKKNLVPMSLTATTSFFRFPLQSTLKTAIFTFFLSFLFPGFLLNQLQKDLHPQHSTKAILAHHLLRAESSGQCSVFLECDLEVAFHSFLLDILISLAIRTLRSSVSLPTPWSHVLHLLSCISSFPDEPQG